MRRPLLEFITVDGEHEFVQAADVSRVSQAVASRRNPSLEERNTRCVMICLRNKDRLFVMGQLDEVVAKINFQLRPEEVTVVDLVDHLIKEHRP